MDRKEIGQKIFDWCIKCKGGEDELIELIETIERKNWRTVEDFLDLEDLVRTDEYMIGLTVLANAYQNSYKEIKYDPYCIRRAFLYILVYQIGEDIKKNRICTFVETYSEKVLKERIDFQTDVALLTDGILQNIKSLTKEEMKRVIYTYIAVSEFFGMFELYTVKKLFKNREIDRDEIYEKVKNIVQKRRIFDVQYIFYPSDETMKRHEKELQEHYYVCMPFKIYYLLKQDILDTKDVQRLFEMDPELERKYLEKYGLQKRTTKQILV